MAAARVQNAKPTPSKKRARPSEKRKEQNREAQRKYREKMKSRRHKLECIVEQIPKTTPQLLRLDPNQWMDIHPDSLADDQFNMSYVPGPMASSDIDWQDIPNFTDIGGVENLDMAEKHPQNFLFGTNVENIHFRTDGGDFWMPNDQYVSVNESPRLGGQVLNSPAAEFQQSILRNSSALEHSQNVFDYGAAEYQFLSGAPYTCRLEPNPESPVGATSLQSLHEYRLQTSSASAESDSEGRSTKTPSISAADRNEISRETIRALCLDDTKENTCLIKTAVARGHSIRSVFLAGLRAMDQHSPTIRPPSPQSNTLTLVRTSTLEAYLTVARTAGIHIPSLHTSHTDSPFYTPSATASEIPKLLSLHAARLPVDLRPTAAQIQIPHRPWLDLLPFPVLRERALRLSAMEPPVLDLAELKNDVFLNDGLFCWRSGRGAFPWESRSWEAEGWFLRKWRLLIGDGDVLAQTEWWRTLRGERRSGFG